MKNVNKWAIVLAVAVLMLSSIQVAWARGGIQIQQGIRIPLASPSTLIDKYRQIPVDSSKKRDIVKFDLNPQPGFDVTLLMNQKVNFEWKLEQESATTKIFVIKNNKGKVVFEQAIGDKNEIDIVPSEIKLKVGQKYSWSVDGQNIHTFTILDKQTEKELMENLAKIEAEKISTEDDAEAKCAINKAIYVQMLSDDPKYNLDLYWLSAQWLLENSPTDKKLQNDRYDLLERCSQHLDKEMK